MKKLIALALALAMLFALTACGGSSDDSSSESTTSDSAETGDIGTTTEDGTRVLRVGCMESGGGFNPTGDNQSTIGNNLVYDRIVQRLADGTYECLLCESYEWTDSTTLVFYLKDNVYFSDGDQLTGEDVIYSFYIQSLGVQSTYYACVDFDNCYVSDDGLTVTFKFFDEYGPFEAMLDTPQIVNKSAVENLSSDDESWRDSPIGSGPYEVVENVSGSHATYRLRDDYWDDTFEAQWDEIIVNYYTEATAMFIAFENGELDLVCSVGANDAARLESGSTSLGDKAAYEFVNTNNVYCLALGSTREEFQDEKVREAIAHCIDVDGLGQVAFGSLYNSSDSVLSSTCNYYVSTGTYEYDVEYAKQCMAESGYPDGFTVNVVGINSTEAEAMWEVIQAGLSEIGITMNLETYELGTALVMWMEEDTTDLMLMSVNGGNPMCEPYLCLSMTMDGTVFPSSVIRDDEYQEHFAAAVYTSDTEQRAEEWEWIQTWLYENYQAIPMVEPLSCYAYNTDVISYCEFNTGESPNLRFCYAAD